MALLEEVADNLAKKAMEIILKTGDDTIEKRIAAEIGSSSPTLQETFLTAMRIRKAEARGYALLEKYGGGEIIPIAAISTQPQDEYGH